MVMGLLALAHNRERANRRGHRPARPSTLADAEPDDRRVVDGPDEAGARHRDPRDRLGLQRLRRDGGRGTEDDFVLEAMPDVAMFSRLRFFKVSAYAGAELNYYHKYQSEQSIGHALRGRVDLLLSRRAAVRWGRAYQDPDAAERRNRRARQPDGRGTVWWSRVRTGPDLLGVRGRRFAPRALTKTRSEEDVDLAQSLTREGMDYSGGVRTDLTPLTALTVSAGVREDTFVFSLRFGTPTAAMITATLKLDAAAVVTGAVTVGFNDFNAGRSARRAVPGPDRLSRAGVFAARSGTTRPDRGAPPGILVRRS